ncbi:MAG: NUDIX domain-containing protein [Actinobacteria bacterium]|nr:NUDIX domain-containing protein [Actinomycetota bacterium]
MTADPGSEAVEVVDGDGVVVRIASRAEMRRDRLRHRCTYIVVVDAEDRVVVHRRAAWKDVWPDRWDLAFGGVAGVGERWEVAAARELAEEAGVTVEPAALEALGGGTYEDDSVAVVGEVYLVRHDGPFTFPDGEVVDHRRVPRDEVVAWITARPHTPDSVVLYRAVTGQA